MDKEQYKNLVSELIEEKVILKKQLHESKTRVVQLECFVADLKDEFLDMGGDKDQIDYMQKQCNEITLDIWEN